MYVAPAHRRHGLGRQLLAACRREADQLGLRRLLLYATPDGKQLYERAGFEPVSYTHLRAHETVLEPVCRLLLETKNDNLVFVVTESEGQQLSLIHISEPTRPS